MKNEINICFDLDGPIIDVSSRYYRAYLESLKEFDTKKTQPLTKEDFWKLKQNRVSDLEIGIITGLTISESKESAEARRDLTFKQEYLSQDSLFNDVTETLEYLRSINITFFVVTLRRKKQLFYAIKQFKLDKYFDISKLFAVEDDGKFSNDIQEKYILLVKAINDIKLDPRETWIIGDSDTDIHVGRLARYKKVIAIDRGIRSRKQLEILKPDHLLSDLRELVSVVSLQF